MPAGRPTKYKPEYCEEVEKHFNIEPHFETPVERRKKGVMETSVKFIASDLPTIEGFAKKIHVSIDTINEWTRVHPEFSEAIKKGKTYQSSILITNTLRGEYNPAFAIFFAKNNMGWKDKQETDITTNGKELTVAGFNYLIPDDKSKDNSTDTTDTKATPSV